MTTTTPPPVPVTDIHDQIIPMLNQGDMFIILALTTTEPTIRTTTALAWRGRTRADAVRFTHATDLAERMPELFDAVGGTGPHTGRFAVDHLDLIWNRINRHLTSVPTTLTDRVRTGLDHAVEPAVTHWLDTTGTASDATTGATAVNLADLRDLVDTVIHDTAPGLTVTTARHERDTATLTRRGRTLTLRCGDDTTAAGIDRALTDRAKKLLAGLRRHRNAADSTADDTRDSADDNTGDNAGPGTDTGAETRTGTGAESLGDLPLPDRATLKAQILLNLLGDNPDTLTVRVNLFRTTTDGIHGTGSAYSPDVGWIDVDTADRLENLARATTRGTVTEIPTDPDALPTTTAYRFPVLVQLAAEFRDGHCRFPGCTVPASRCDKDHIINSPHTDPTSDGTTSIDNLQNLCPEHHRAKTLGHWTCTTDDRGLTVTWTGPHGEKHTTTATGPGAALHHPDAGPDPTDITDITDITDPPGPRPHTTTDVTADTTDPGPPGPPEPPGPPRRE